MGRDLGKVTNEEADAIFILFSRKRALEELLPTLNLEKDEALYDRIIRDLSDTNSKMSNWWQTVSSKYHWEFSKGDSWWIDFDTNSVSLI